MDLLWVAGHRDRPSGRVGRNWGSGDRHGMVGDVKDPLSRMGLGSHAESGGQWKGEIFELRFGWRRYFVRSSVFVGVTVGRLKVSGPSPWS